VKYKKRKPAEYKDKLCVVCGKAYQAKSPKAKFCSGACSDMSSYKNRMLSVDFRVNKLMAMAKNRAKEKSLPFDLDLPYLLDLWNSQEGKCPITGTNFVLESGTGRVHKDSPSIDRIEPALGYVKGNVRFTTYHINVALSEFGLESLYELAQKIVSFR
jgi:predicted nucleic acid-binding Zn ribbon protein